MQLYCPERKTVLETRPDALAAGAEGRVFEVPGEPGILAKVFLDPNKHDRREKIDALIANPFRDAPSPDGHRRFAAPQEILIDPKTGRFAGYLMPQVNGQPLGEFIDPAGSMFRGKALRVKLGIALAELIAEVHRHQLMIVVGDLNPQNLLGDAQARVALIDLDSVQLTTVHGRTYLCPVGTDFYLPRELLGQDLSTVRRTPEHDRFALAVILFRLLFDGWHPFDATADPQRNPSSRIRAGDWPHAPGSKYLPPPSAPPFGGLPNSVQRLFVRAFFEGHWDPTTRPTAEEWVDELSRNERQLAKARPAMVRVPAAAPTGQSLTAGSGRPLSLAGTVLLALVGSALGLFAAWWIGSGLSLSAPPSPASGAYLQAPPQAFGDGTQTPRYWQHVQDGGDAPLSFDSLITEPSRGEP